MRTPRSLITAAAIAASLAAPAGALAQSAGDEQYTDPFGQSGTPAQGQQQQEQQGAAGQAPSQTAAPAPDSGQAAPAQAAPAQLPRTGGSAVVLTLTAGSLMLLAGFAIRRDV